MPAARGSTDLEPRGGDAHADRLDTLLRPPGSVEGFNPAAMLRTVDNSATA